MSESAGSPDPDSDGRCIIRGFVADSTTGEPLPYANIIIRNTPFGTSSNTQGYFVIPRVPAGLVELRVSMLGYNTKTIRLTVLEREVRTLRIMLTPTSIQTQEISIVGQRAEEKNPTDLGIEKITVRQIDLIPATVEADVFRVLQVLPGVSMTGDVSAKYFVRGGAGDQNLVLLNGATVYYPFHALGLFSVIDPEMISGMEFYKGGFTSLYGGRLSSVLDISTRDGNKNNFAGSLQMGVATGKVSVEGPFRNGSFLFTGRKSYYGASLNRILNATAIPFDFYDLSFKINDSEPAIDENSKFSLYGFVSQDNVIHRDPLKEDYTLGNSIMGLQWHKIWDAPLFTQVSISHSGFAADVRPNFSNARKRYNNVRDFTVQAIGAYVYDSNDEFDFGVTHKTLLVDLDIENKYGQVYRFSQEARSLQGFLDYSLNTWEQVALSMGLRFNFSTLSEGLPILFEPRINLSYRPHPIIAFKAGVGYYSQEIVTLTNDNELISIFEPVIVVPSYLYAPQAIQYMAGIETFVTENFKIDLEGYYKPIRYLLDVNPFKYSPADRDYRSLDGESYGMEWMGSYDDESIYARLTYSLSWAYKINKGGVREIPRYDVRHAVNTVFSIGLGDNWEAGFLWTFKTGFPFTPVSGFYDQLTYDPWSHGTLLTTYTPSILWGARNSSRLAPYHRLDINISKTYKVDWFDLSVGASIVNLYNQRNIFYYDLNTGKPEYMMPFSLGGYLKFAF